MATRLILLFFSHQYSRRKGENQVGGFFFAQAVTLRGGLSVIYANPRYDGGRFTLSPQKASAFSIHSEPIPSNSGVLK
jgi:hypothetical protein